MTSVLARSGVQPTKGFGQNFLVDDAALAAIVSAAELRPGEAVLEVGPGLGVLTRALLAAGANVTAVELDGRLIPVLEEEFGAQLAAPPGPGHLTLLHADALRIDLGDVAPGSKLVANLPYNVATPLLARFLASGRFGRLVFLVQREVGERLAARPGSAAYGALSLLVEHFGRARVLRMVPPGAFLPPPAVTSAVVRIDTDTSAQPDPELFDLIHEGFAHRRKTLAKNLRLAGYDPRRVEEVMGEVGIDPRARAEELDLATFRRLRGHLRRGHVSS